MVQDLTAASPALVQEAREAGLRYTSDESRVFPQHQGNHFALLRPGWRSHPGRGEFSPASKSLVIPPAWTDVWICPLENGHVQATAATRAARKQYRYHPRWREQRDESKFGHMLKFARGAAENPPARRARPPPSRACRGKRFSPRWCGCSRRRSSASATTSMRAKTIPTASPPCATATSR